MCGLLCLVKLDGSEHEYNYTINKYGFIRPGVRLIMYASPITPGIIVLHDMICTRSSEYRPERGLQERSGKYDIISDPAGRTRGSREWPPFGLL